MTSRILEDTPHGAGRLPLGFRMGTHSHTQGQLKYAAAGALATTTERGTWVAPANRVTRHASRHGRSCPDGPPITGRSPAAATVEA